VLEQSTKVLFMQHSKRKMVRSGLMMLPPMRYKSGDRETVTILKSG
jgi:hypothetical protein